MKKRIQSLPLSSIRIDGGTQPREEINSETVDNYAERMEIGDSFPPIAVFFDGVDYWLADGFHRFHASRKAGMTEVECEVNTGTKREAVLFAVGCNDKHGLPRTNADKRKSVEMLLSDPEWSQWSAREIASRCGVHHSFVCKMRETVSFGDTVSKVKFTTPTGKISTHIVKPREPKQVEVDKTDSEESVNTNVVKVDKDLARAAREVANRRDDSTEEDILSHQPIQRHQQLDISNAMSIAQQAVNILRNIPLTDVNRKKAFVYVRNLCNEALEE